LVITQSWSFLPPICDATVGNTWQTQNKAFLQVADATTGLRHERRS
jgi:hypothetical protein